jgi:hypothetical protein
MELNDKKRFLELITGLAHTFGMEMSVKDIENYWLFLRSYSLAEFEKAVIHYCASPEGYRFMPKPGELIAAIEGNALQQAQQAWSKVLNAVRRVGGDNSVIFDDALIHGVIYDMGGWVRLCEMYQRDESFKQREFESRYVAYRHHPPKLYPQQLYGRMAGINGILNPLPRREPIMVGEEEKAKLVFQKGVELAKLSSYKTLSLKKCEDLKITKGLNDETEN